MCNLILNKKSLIFSIGYHSIRMDFLQYFFLIYKEFNEVIEINCLFPT